MKSTSFSYFESGGPFSISYLEAISVLESTLSGSAMCGAAAQVSTAIQVSDAALIPPLASALQCAAFGCLERHLTTLELIADAVKQNTVPAGVMLGFRLYFWRKIALWNKIKF